MMRNAPLVLLALLSAACGNVVTTPGELGKAKFEWAPCDHTTFDNCPLSEAMATGSTAHVNVYNASELAAFTPSSSDETVFTVAVDGTTIKVQGLLAGTAKLVLTSQATSEVIDRVAITVSDTATIKETSPTTNWVIGTMAGGQFAVGLAVLDAGGGALVGDGVYTAGSGITVTTPTSPSAVRRILDVTAQSTGATTVTLAFGPTTATLGVYVATPAEIASVAVSGDGTAYYTNPGSGNTSLGAALYAAAALADGTQVIAPITTWSVDRADCFSLTPTGTNGWEVEVSPLRANCNGTVTATIGSQSATAPVTSLPLN
jgi:hypothetical protein